MSFTCQNCRDLFSHFLDQDMDQSVMLHFKHHLDECLGCAEEWNAFNETLLLLHDLPRLTAPSDFLPGINAKLYPPSLLDRIKAWLAFSHHKTAYATGFVTLAVALTTAALLQQSPVAPNPSQERLATNQTTKSTNPVIQLAKMETAPVNFYPGVPSLAEYKTEVNIRQHFTERRSGGPAYQSIAAQPAYLPVKHCQTFTDRVYRNFFTQAEYLQTEYPLARRSVVSLASSPYQTTNNNILTFASTGSYNRSANPFSNLSSYGLHKKMDHTHQKRLIKADITITLHDQGHRAKNLTGILESPKWVAKMYSKNIMLLSVAPEHLNLLRQSLHLQHPSYHPPHAREANPGSPKRELLVAIKLP